MDNLIDNNESYQRFSYDAGFSDAQFYMKPRSILRQGQIKFYVNGFIDGLLHKLSK